MSTYYMKKRLSCALFKQIHITQQTHSYRLEWNHQKRQTVNADAAVVTGTASPLTAHVS